MPFSANDITISAPLAAVAFLGTALVLGLILFAAVVAAWRRAPRLGAMLLAAGSVVVLGYGGVLAIASLRSQDRVLPQGGAKYFCELDCHLAYSVAGVERVPDGTRERLVVRVSVRFDPATIGPRRGDAPLTPNPRLVEVVDAAGRHYPASTGARGVPPGGGSATLADPLRPGESTIVSLSFDLPADVRDPRLWITGGDWVNRLLIGHERSPGHGKVYLALG